MPASIHVPTFRRSPRGSVVKTLVSAALAAAAINAAARGQCQTQEMISPDGTTAGRYSEAVAIRGDLAVVTELFNDEAGLNTGAAFVYRLAGDTWVVEDKLLPSDRIDHLWFGRAAATDGERIVVGAVQRDDLLEAVYVYAYDEPSASWVEKARLVASDAEPEDLFGSAVAIEGDTIVVGAPLEDEAWDDAGAVYVFRFDGAAWSEHAKLVASDARPSDEFGTSVDVDGGVVFAGAPGLRGTTGACYVLREDGGWQETKLLASDGALDDRFGAAVAADDGALVVGAWRRAPSGAAYLFRFEPLAGVWIEDAILEATVAEDVGFGGAVDVSGDAVLVGTWPHFGRYGRAYLFRPDGASWAGTRIRPTTGAFADFFGGAVTIDGGVAMIGSRRDDNDNGRDAGTARAYAIPALPAGDCNCNGVPDDEDIASGTSEDCNDNGVPDECEDCNGNGVADECDIDGGTSPDCNENGAPDECDLAWGDSDDDNDDGVPDECQTLFRYVDVEWKAGRGWLENGYVELWTFRIYAQFTGQDNGVLAVFGAPGRPLFLEGVGGETFHNDLLLDSLTAPLDLRASGYWSNQWDTYVTIGAVQATGDETQLSFLFAERSGGLAGDFTSEDIGWFVLPGSPQSFPDEAGRVLLAQVTVPCGVGIFGTFNLLLVDGSEETGHGFWFHPEEAPEHTALTARGLDCNQNCYPDDLDVERGFVSRDCNGNGVPDECEGEACLTADLDCSGAVDFAEVLTVLSAWGPCDICDEDLDASGSVDFADILAVLAAWGTCAS